MFIQAEEDALVARVEARIRYALSQPQHRTDTHPLGVMPLPQNYEDDAITADGLIISPTGTSTLHTHAPSMFRFPCALVRVTYSHSVASRHKLQ